MRRPAHLSLAFWLLVAAFGFGLADGRRAEAEENVMNWRAALPRAESRPSIAGPPTYRARRRADPVMRYPDDAALGLHMPPLRVEMPLIADPSAPKILIVGDSLAEALAAGFDGDSGIRAAYRLVERTISASGLVREDFFDWPKTMAGLIRDHGDLAAIVIMVGLNDRQGLRAGEVTHEVLSEPWREEYRKRIDAMLNLAREARVPLVWVGLPPMRQPKLSAELAAINALIRDRVTAAGQNFVETADAFADSSGGFSANGPDVIGDIVRLRGPDGIHFTPPGQRKLAFFVEQPLRRILGAQPVAAPSLASLPAASAGPQTPASLLNSANPPSGPLASSGFPPREGLRLGPALPAIGERRALGEVRQAGSLLSIRAPAYGDVTNRDLFDRGIVPKSRPGRADDHGWR